MKKPEIGNDPVDWDSALVIEVLRNSENYADADVTRAQLAAADALEAFLTHPTTTT